jgi:uncharacterized protein YidB (DUF937 family)
MDVLRGMQHGPHGQPTPSAGSPPSGGAGMSPITMAILGLLAYKAVKGLAGGGQAEAPGGAGRAPQPSAAGDVDVATRAETGGGETGGTLADLFKGGLGGLLSGGAAGGILGGGLKDLLKQLQQSGLEDEAKSWIGTGPNKTIAPNDLAKALGADQINAMMEHSGLSRDELLEGLSHHLPRVVDQLTPEGQVPRKIPM